MALPDLRYLDCRDGSRRDFGHMGARARRLPSSRYGGLEMTAEAAYRIGAGADERRGRRTREEALASQEATASREASSQAVLNALLGELLPRQGCWSDEGYLWLTDHGNRLVELTDGFIEELPMPTDTHQTILAFLHVLFRVRVQPHGGVVVASPLRIRIREGKFREPDLLLLRDRSDPLRRNRYWLGADLVVEVLSPDDPDRDLVEKRADYAEAKIPEYWIADPRDETITVLVLRGEAYVEHGRYARGELAASVLLEGLAVEASAVFDAPETGG